MATMNPFDLLGDNDNEDLSQLVSVQQPKLADKPKKSVSTPQAQSAAKPAPKFPTKPTPPTQAVRDSKTESGRGGGRGSRGRGFGRGGGGRGYDRDSSNNDTFGGSNGFSGGYKPSEEGEEGKPSERRSYGAPRGSFRGGRRGVFGNGESGEGDRPRRQFERRSGTGRGNEIKRDGAGRGNWGTPADEIAPETEEPVVENEKNVSADKPAGEEDVGANKENPVNEQEDKEPEEKEMTLDVYEKLLEEKRKALLALKTEERKVDVDKEFKSMQPLSSKKSNDDIFVKLGSDKDKRKDAADKEEKAKKSVSINEFLKPAEGERYYNPGSRGRGRGRGSRGGYGGYSSSNVAAPSIEDPGHFPSLGGK
ncbi:RGG repeats nuclear RNA binding protein A-like isoform X2 [Mangifera indica]|uniref:RGG repeats nuclear RNA binding protein A-like isoform X2 n=1 Tax=Mangifera indica TaxID=29780 RepID=UPI001CFA3B4C|nr:RGG repeats nuclear RNA binding protein A-like isoform X2 [Mangifera indica]